MKLKQRDIALISFAVSLLVALVWYFTFYQPKGDEIVAQQGTRDNLQMQVDRAREASAALPRLREEVAKLEVDKQEFLRQLPETVRFGEFLQDLRRIVAESGSTLNSIAPGASSSAATLPAGVVAINVNMSLDTTFPGLLRAVSSIQELQRFSTINNIDLTIDNGPTTTRNLSNPSLKCTLVLTVYTFDVTKAMPSTPPAGTTPDTTTPDTTAPQGGNAS